MSRMEASEKRRIVEALILSSPDPIPAAKLAEIIPYCDAGQAKDLVNELNTEYAEQDRSFEIWEVAGGYQIRTRAEFSGYLQKLQKERALRLSQAALETLAIIAYRQPTTRAEIEDVRGVDAGATVKSLLERHLIRIAGQREVPGRPMVYATTRRFLEVFGLERLKDLPTLRELDELAREQGLLDKAGDEESEGEAERTAEEGQEAVASAEAQVGVELENDGDAEAVGDSADVEPAIDAERDAEPLQHVGAAEADAATEAHTATEVAAATEVARAPEAADVTPSMADFGSTEGAAPSQSGSETELDDASGDEDPVVH